MLFPPSAAIRTATAARLALGRTLAARCASSASAFPPEKNVLRSRLAELQIPDLNVFDCVWRESAANHGDKTALVDSTDDRHFTYAECHDASLRMALGLREVTGLNQGDVLALLLPNCPEYMFLFTGAAAVGVAVTTINNMYTASEVARQLKMSKAKVVVTLDSYLDKLKEAIDKLPGSPSFKIVVLPADRQRAPDSLDHGLIPYSQLTRCSPLSRDDFHVDLKDSVVMLPYSSGTTGVSKGVMLTHANLVANAWQLIYSKEVEFVKPATESFQCRTVSVLPLFHIYGMHVTALTTLHVGGKLVLMPGFEPKAFVKQVEKIKPTFLHLVPPLVDFCASHPSVTREHLSSLEAVMVGAAPVGPALVNSFKKKSPQTIVREGWGMSECLVCTVTGLKDEVVGSCGIAACNTEMKVVDVATGENLGPNQRGEICVRGPQVMKGYLDNEEATRETIDSKGWLHSGDIGYYSESEHFFIVDRLKELIKVKGLQVPPAELENLIRSHPLVADVAVIGVPHERLGNAPRAYVVPKDKSLTDDDVHALVNAEVAEFKRLVGGVQFVDAIPKSSTGKILRRLIVDKYNEENSQKQALSQQ